MKELRQTYPYLVILHLRFKIFRFKAFFDFKRIFPQEGKALDVASLMNMIDHLKSFQMSIGVANKNALVFELQGHAHFALNKLQCLLLQLEGDKIISTNQCHITK